VKKLIAANRLVVPNDLHWLSYFVKKLIPANRLVVPNDLHLSLE
jgi:hypothetical protein